MSTSDYSKIRSRITGPVYPIPPAFKKNSKLDLASTKSYVKFLVKQNVRTLLVTAGTSRLNLLSNEETKDFNAVVVAANKGKALTIVANPMHGSVEEAIGFSKHAKQVGADGILLYYPERYYDDNTVCEYFETIARNTHIPLLIHGVPLRRAAAGGTPTVNYSVELCKRLSRIPNIVGMKEEFGNENLRYKLAVHIQKQIPLIVSGSSMRKFLSCVNFGVRSYLVGIGSFIPRKEEEFFNFVERSRYNDALEIVEEFEEPFFDVAFSMGWHVAMKTAMNIMGLMPPYERAPLKMATKMQERKIKEKMKRLGII